MNAMKYTADELGQVLRNMVFGMNTGGLSQLDEATMKWALVHPELSDRQRKFADARHGWWPGDPRRDTPEAWHLVVVTAIDLGERIRTYGDEVLPLCGRPSVYGPQCRAVVVGGKCSYGEDTHTDRQGVAADAPSR